jgi:peroxiredoxin
MSSKRIAENIIQTYGLDKFRRLLELFSSNTSCTLIAKEYDVTRQRAHQWKSALGKERRTFILNSEIEAMLGITSRGRILV